MGNPIRLFLAIFSLFRLASLVSSEEGPYLPFIYKNAKQMGVFKWIRMKAGAYEYGPDGLPLTALGRGISCPLCTAAYLGFLIVILFRRPTLLGDLILSYLGIYGAQVFLENLTSDDAIKEAIEEVAESLEDT